MNISDIENLSSAELKARRDELLAALKDAAPADVAARYLQARTDARLRDEKLAEQGATITALQSGLAAATERIESYGQTLATATQTIAALKDEGLAAKADVETLTDRLVAETARADQATALAKARRGVLAVILHEITPLLAQES